jgi:PAS domain S-box-containing protein
MIGEPVTVPWMRLVLQNTSDVICVLGADGTFLYVSPAIESVLGYLPENLVGTVSFDYVHPDDAAFVTESFAQILKTPGVHAPVEFRARAADGSLRHVEAIPNNMSGLSMKLASGLLSRSLPGLMWTGIPSATLLWGCLRPCAAHPKVRR